MSGKNGKQTDSSVTDAKLSEDDKFGECSTIDSGFISSGNIIVYSGDIHDEEVEEQLPESKQQAAVPLQEEHMRLDSGVYLSESFSALRIKDPKLNDLSASSKTKAFEEPQTPVAANITEESWKECFEQDEDGNTYLHIAILEGFLEVVLAIIRRAPHPRLLDTPNDCALTPIHIAASLQNYKVVRWLIVAGAQPSPRDISGDSPLHIAARNGDLNTCSAILAPVEEREIQELALSYPQQPYRQLDLNQWNYEGQTCVHVAACKGHVEILRHLVWCGADINAREGLGGYTALHFAVERSDERLLSFLLRECKKLQADVVNYEGRSVLELGCKLSSVVFDALRQRGVPTPSSSDDEFDSDSDSDVAYENTMFRQNMVVQTTA